MGDFFSAHTAGLVFILVVIYFAVHSDYMVRVHLSKIDGAVVGNYTTTKGTVIQGAMTISMYLISLGIASLLD